MSSSDEEDNPLVPSNMRGFTDKANAGRSMAPDSHAGLSGRGGLIRVVLWQPTVRRSKDDRPPNMTTELFVDLITASACGAMRTFFVTETQQHEHDPFFQTLASYVVLFFPLWWTSHETMLFMNRFHCGDCAFNLYILGYVILVTFQLNNLSDCKYDCSPKSGVICAPKGLTCKTTIETHDQYAIFAHLKAMLFIWTALPYAKALYYMRLRSVRMWCSIRIVGNFIAACICLVAATTTSVAPRRALGLTVVTLQLSVEYVLCMSGKKWSFASLQPAHMGKRMSKFTLIVLAQAMGSVQQQGLASRTFTSEGYSFTIGMLFIALLLKIVYYDLDRVSAIEVIGAGGFKEWAWIIGHLAFAMALVIFGASAQALVSMTNPVVGYLDTCAATEIPGNTIHSVDYAKHLFCGSFGMLLLVSSGLIMLVKKEPVDALGRLRHQIRKRHRALFRLFIAFLIGTAGLWIMPLQHFNLDQESATAVDVVWVVAACLIMLAIFIIYGVSERKRKNGMGKSAAPQYRWQDSFLGGTILNPAGGFSGRFGRTPTGLQASLLQGSMLHGSTLEPLEEQAGAGARQRSGVRGQQGRNAYASFSAGQESQLPHMGRGQLRGSNLGNLRGSNLMGERGFAGPGGRLRGSNLGNLRGSNLDSSLPKSGRPTPKLSPKLRAAHPEGLVPEFTSSAMRNSRVRFGDIALEPAVTEEQESDLDASGDLDLATSAATTTAAMAPPQDTGRPVLEAGTAAGTAAGQEHKEDHHEDHDDGDNDFDMPGEGGSIGDSVSKPVDVEVEMPSYVPPTSAPVADDASAPAAAAATGAATATTTGAAADMGAVDAEDLEPVSFQRPGKSPSRRSVRVESSELSDILKGLDDVQQCDKFAMPAPEAPGGPGAVGSGGGGAAAGGSDGTAAVTAVAAAAPAAPAAAASGGNGAGTAAGSSSSSSDDDE